MTSSNNDHNDGAGPGADRLAKLASKAAEAAAIRAHQTHPDVIALAVERVRFQVDTLLWVAIVAGLGFTMVNVQQFAAQHTTEGSLAWWTAWLLDPMVSLALLAVLLAEQVTARYQVALGLWPRITKWFTFAATYVMNTWQAFGLDAEPFSLSGVVLHSVPPLVVFLAAETGPGLRDRLTEAVRAAISEAHGRATDQPATTTATVVVTAPVVAATTALDKPAGAPVLEASRATAPAPARRRSGKARRGKQPAPRVLFAEHLALARAQLTAQTEVSPAWCREVTGCGRTTSIKLAKALHAEQAMPHVPNYPADDAENRQEVAA